MPKLHRVKLPESSKATFGYEWRVVGDAEHVFRPGDVILDAGGAANLKALYEPLIEEILSEQGLSFVDLSGGPEGAAEFWANIDRHSITKANRKTEGLWEIPFEQIEFLPSSSTSS